VSDTAASQTPVVDTIARVYAVVEGKSSLLYVRPANGKEPHRLTNRKGGWESGGVFSRNGALIAYATADEPYSHSEVWISKADGTGAHRVSAAEEDALTPLFGAGDSSLLYIKSGFYGHYSPIAGSRRHKLDVMKVSRAGDGAATSAPVQMTQQEFYEVNSLSLSNDGNQFLLCTSAYPIGSLLEEFEEAKPLRTGRIFQPHIPGAPRTPSDDGESIFGEAGYTKDSLDIVFTAASQGKSGNYDYNVYRINGVTGDDLAALTHDTGVIDDMHVDRDGIIVVRRGKHFTLVDPYTGAQKEEKDF
jgi:Tol biopolymer transport system component